MSSKISHSQEGQVHEFSLELGGRRLIIKTGEYASQANASCSVQYGETVVLATAVMAKQPRSGISFFPLLVDFEEKFYAAGKIKGSRFIKREGRPSDDAILSGRIVDRSIRPFFDQSSRIDVQVVINTLSWDGANDPDELGIIAASCALHISDIPWGGPVVGIRLGYKDGKWLTNPSYEERESTELDLLVAVREDKAVMIEAEASEVAEEIVAEGVEQAIRQAQPILELLGYMRDKIGLEKRDMGAEIDPEIQKRRSELKSWVSELTKEPYKKAFGLKDKQAQNAIFDQVKQSLVEALDQRDDLEEADKSFAIDQLEEVLLAVTKEMYLHEGQRVDGRAFDEVRPLSARVGVLPRTHGTGVFQRGETQALSVVTLGAASDEQILDTMEETDTKKRYFHHYNFPGFSVGEVRPNRGAGRREIGHGALAEKALERVLPDKESFPYTIRVVSEVLSSNGSSSMASTCGSTLALMDAGVPIKKPVAGIAMGIITADQRPEENYKIMTDIQGLEDHYGEMDFKVTGTDTGITAMQLDVKNLGVNSKMTGETLKQAKKARLQILDVMKQTIAAPRAELSPYAPRITSFKINPEKIRIVIGPGGKMINEIVAETGVKLDIEDDGLVMITSKDPEAAARAQKWVHDIVRDLEAGESFEQAKITRIFPFGAMAEVLPGKEGLIHISELAPWHVGEVEDVVKIGDVVPVKVVEIDSEGRPNLSLKATDYEYPPEVRAKGEQTPPERLRRPGAGQPPPRTGFGGRHNDRRGPRSGSGPPRRFGGGGAHRPSRPRY